MSTAPTDTEHLGYEELAPANKQTCRMSCAGGSGCHLFQLDDYNTAHEGLCSAISGCGEGNFSDGTVAQGSRAEPYSCNKCCVVKDDSEGGIFKCQEFCDVAGGSSGNANTFFAVLQYKFMVILFETGLVITNPVSNRKFLR